MITQTQKDLEDMFYETLKKEDFGTDVISKFPNQSPEELADILTKTLMNSWIGYLIDLLGKSLKGYDKECEGAFKEAVLRLLREAALSSAEGKKE